MIVTRFAPSPNGPLHLGHAYSAIQAHDAADERAGRFLLRIEDIDGARSRADLAEAFRADLAWLGLEYEEVPMQSARLASYAEAARSLQSRGLLYPCSCTRAEIASESPALGPDGPVYSGKCLRKGAETGKPVAWRLDMAAAVKRAGQLVWHDEIAGEQRAQPELFGDVVLVRKDEPASYHLAATLDDAADGIGLVTRGSDLFAATHIHRLLQSLLDLPVPRWRHHPLLLDKGGTKLAKRRGSGSGALGLAEMRLAGKEGAALAEALRAGRFPAGITLSKA